VLTHSADNDKNVVQEEYNKAIIAIKKLHEGMGLIKVNNRGSSKWVASASSAISRLFSWSLKCLYYPETGNSKFTSVEKCFFHSYTSNCSNVQNINVRCKMANGSVSAHLQGFKKFETFLLCTNYAYNNILGKSPSGYEGDIILQIVTKV